MASSCTFFLNGEKVQLLPHEVHPRMTLLDYLREKTSYKGTKASCTQGGCGACNVMLSTWNGDKAGYDYKSINACLRPLLTLDGASVTTTEGIGSADDGFHPVQQRIADCNGTQCGYCTPGKINDCTPPSDALVLNYRCRPIYSLAFRLLFAF